MQQLVFFLLIGFQLFAQEVTDSVGSSEAPSAFYGEINACMCSVDAQFPGGHKALQSFVNRTFKSPSGISIASTQRRIYVSFTVTVEGLIEDIKIERGIDPSIDEELIRILKKMPVWLPQEVDCGHLETRVLIPIKITLI